MTGQKAGRRVTRIKITVPEESVRRLKAMQVQAGAASIADVLGQAVRIYAAVLREQGVGSLFFIKRPGKEVEDYKIFAVD